MWKHDARRAECFHRISSFPIISTSVDITVYQHRKNVLYFFYNIAQRNIKYNITLLNLRIGGKFSVLTLSYINTALTQSAFRVYKCYIIIEYLMGKQNFIARIHLAHILDFCQLENQLLYLYFQKMILKDRFFCIW